MTAESLVPVNMSANALHAEVKNQGGGDVPVAPIERLHQPAAKNLATWEQESYQLSATLASKVGFPIWSASTNDTVKVMLFGTSRYLDVVDNDHTYRYGVSIRVLLEIVDSKNDAKMSLPAIAAQVELGVVQANSQLIVTGYTGEIGNLLPKWQAFDVDAYSDYMNAVSALQTKIFSDPANAKPVLLSASLASKLTAASGGVSRVRWFSSRSAD
jgi:hypothetical protein